MHVRTNTWPMYIEMGAHTDRGILDDTTHTEHVRAAVSGYTSLMCTLGISCTHWQRRPGLLHRHWPRPDRCRRLYITHVHSGYIMHACTDTWPRCLEMGAHTDRGVLDDTTHTEHVRTAVSGYTSLLCTL